jgi:hypothetical protein
MFENVLLVECACMLSSLLLGLKSIQLGAEARHATVTSETGFPLVQPLEYLPDSEQGS